MSGKGVRNLIIALVILAVGVKLIGMISNNYIATAAIPESMKGLVGSVESMSNLFIIGIGILIVILIPIYLAKRGDKLPTQGK